MTFSGKIDNGVRLVGLEQKSHQFFIADVAAHQNMIRVACQRRQIGRISCIGELVEIDDADSGAAGLKHIGRANEPRAAGYQLAGHGHIFLI